MVDHENDKSPAVPGLLQDVVLDSQDVEEFLTKLVTIAGHTLSAEHDEVLCGVTLLRARTKTTVASNSPDAQKMDEVQYEYNDGPCLRAARLGTVHYVCDFDAEERFPEYSRAIADHGIKSALGVPIPLEGEATAALNFYSPLVDAFKEDAIEAAQHFAEEVSASLRLAVRIAKLTESSEDMRAAMESRTTIDLAVGVIMGQNRCSQDEAMSILKTASSARNIKLRDVAASVVQSLGQGPAKTHFE
ncbi:GAF and ANTAR domain-containing protein [Arthrobacter sp. NamB2]|uniref:GAF and ANTAR domain-containing protein n=1 Tax=Arthrobacter sp. NamB2 TaxID=2576035 RepID=UPI0010CA0E4A|nr:GAF and ANTAR domain-containing protein [Arthrobacter sp. NamB2]TKV29075.1 GAF and ANTAR domain-containing protein [Arthrobacter sp. NamB2]